MKKYGYATILAAALTLMLPLYGCAIQNEETPEPEISYADMENVPIIELRNTIDEYLTAVTNQDYQGITKCTSKSFRWNYDQTGFLEYSRNKTGYSELLIDSQYITSSAEGYVVPAMYYLTIERYYPDGSLEGYSDVEVNVSFSLGKSDNRWVINAVSDQPAG